MLRPNSSALLALFLLAAPVAAQASREDYAKSDANSAALKCTTFLLGPIPRLYRKIEQARSEVGELEALQKPSRESPQSSAPSKKITLQNLVGTIPPRLKQVVELITHAQEFQEKYGFKVPRGILLYGPPGTGKTYFAQALAGELSGEGEPAFLYRSATSFDDKYVGEGEKHIREFFEEGRRLARERETPIILFIDEIDALAQQRSATIANRRGLINELLTQMDGFDSTDNLIVIGATNTREDLDPAILRSGRLDYQIEINKPDFASRQQLFIYYLGQYKSVDPGIDVALLAQPEFTPADIKNVVDQAMHKVACARKAMLTQADLEEAVNTIMQQK